MSEPRFIGRFDFSDPVGPKFAWTGSTIKALFEGDGIKAVFNAVDAEQTENYLNIIVDGIVRDTLRIEKNGEYTLASDLPYGIHTIEVFKRNEAEQGELQFRGFEVINGTLLAAPKPADRRIEFIGDSLTCGFGNEASDKEAPFIASQENGYLAYGSITARNLGAEQHSIAWSGKGIFRDYNGSTTEMQIPELYLRMLPGRQDSRWDFSWNPHVIVINLGTNDFSIGIPEKADFVGAYTKFITLVHGKYPESHLYCAVGPCLEEDKLIACRGYMTQMVEELRSSGDLSVHYIEFPQQDGSLGYGALWHPSLKTHQQMAEILTKQLQTDLGW